MKFIDQNLIKEVYDGSKMPSFQLLAEGIESEWIYQLEPKTPNKLPDNIPLLISQYWHDYKLTDEIERNVSLMKEFNPELKHYIACDESARSFIDKTYGREFTYFYDNCFHATMRSDFWRICWLYEYGGIYVDIDTQCHAPLINIAAGGKFKQMLFYSKGHPWCVDNDFIITTPKSEVILEILKGQLENIKRIISTKQFENVWVETGPGITTMATMRWLARKFIEENLLPIETGLVFRHREVADESFYAAVDMKYKSTFEGNWREARIPS